MPQASVVPVVAGSEADANADRIASYGLAGDAKAADLAPIIKELRAAGKTSLRAIAAGLNEQGIPTARGGEWSSVQVMRILERLDRFREEEAAAA